MADRFSPLRAVLPTCVGMVRRADSRGRSRDRSPHVRGDGPTTRSEGDEMNAFSPRAWGWSGFTLKGVVRCSVLPTCVGMVRSLLAKHGAHGCSPHVRGDGPKPWIGLDPTATFSPRAWGWSGLLASDNRDDFVLPTCVGMVRGVLNSSEKQFRSPHVRGDGPPHSWRYGVR